MAWRRRSWGAGRTACTEFLGNLHLCRIECIWSEGDQFKFVGRWFALPEETHTGRQAHHARREVFLTNTTDENNVDSLLRTAVVLPPQQFRDAERLRMLLRAPRDERPPAESM